MRLLVIAAACALAVAGSASAQTKGNGPYSSQIGSQAQVQTGHTASMPGPAARPATMAGSTMARPATMAQPMSHHRMARHHMGRHRMARHHGRTHSASACMRRAKMHKMSKRGMTHFIERCEAGRHHHHRGHAGHHRGMHRTTTTTVTTTAPAQR